MSDRLSEIKERLAIPGVWYKGDSASPVDIAWLVAEVERLTQQNLDIWFNLVPARVRAQAESGLASLRDHPGPTDERIGGDGPRRHDYAQFGSQSPEQIALQTEQEMHAAWRKRAEEAEAQLAALRDHPGGVDPQKEK